MLEDGWIPYGLAAHPDGRRLFATMDSGWVFVVDLERMELIGDAIASGVTGGGAVLSTDGSVLYPLGSGNLQQIDTDTMRLIGPPMTVRQRISRAGEVIYTRRVSNT